MWFLSAFPWGVEIAGEDSYAGQIGKFIAPIFHPLGLAWRETVALISGLFAKEIVVSTMGVLYGLGGEAGEQEIGAAIAGSHLTPLSGYAMMAFVLIYAPCVAAIAAVKRETGSWKWTAISVGYLCGLAWLVGFIIYQGGKLLGLE